MSPQGHHQEQSDFRHMQTTRELARAVKSVRYGQILWMSLERIQVN